MYVGMNRYGLRGSEISPRVPHVRGDEPNYNEERAVLERRSPCTWG